MTVKRVIDARRETTGWMAACVRCAWLGETRQKWEQAADDSHDHAVDHDYEQEHAD